MCNSAVGEDGWAKPRIRSVDSYQWTGMLNADDSLAPRKYEIFSLNQDFLPRFQEDWSCGMFIMWEKELWVN